MNSHFSVALLFTREQYNKKYNINKNIQARVIWVGSTQMCEQKIKEFCTEKSYWVV